MSLGLETSLKLHIAPGKEELLNWRLPALRETELWEQLLGIQQALLRDDLDAAIERMSALTESEEDSSLQNQLIHQTGRYHANARSNNIGTISAEQYQRTRNQLRYALQAILNDFLGYSAAIAAEAQKRLTEEEQSQPPEGYNFNLAEETVKILLFAANPGPAARLQLEKEHSRMSVWIQNSANAASFVLKARQAPTLVQFAEALLEERPAVIHFAGHGEVDERDPQLLELLSRGRSRTKGGSVPEDAGIVFSSEDGREYFSATPAILRRIFSNLVQRQQIPVRAILFNGCYTESQARAAAEIVPFTAGTSRQMKEEAAVAFATGLYSFLAGTGNLEAAWENGVTQAMSYGEPEDRFFLHKHDTGFDFSAKSSEESRKPPIPDNFTPIPDNFKILMLPSNPLDDGKLQLDLEHRIIMDRVMAGADREQFRIAVHPVETLVQCRDAVSKERPNIIHFSGRGEWGKQEGTRQSQQQVKGTKTLSSYADGDPGIRYFDEKSRRPVTVSPDDMYQTFQITMDKQEILIRAVLLNRCYSVDQAAAIADLVPNVFGTKPEIKEEAGTAFLTGFYSFLIRTGDFEAAWDNGVTMAMAYGEPEERFIYFKDGKRVNS